MNEPMEMIPEYTAVGEVLNDIALRVQQTLIALQVYQEQMDKTGAVLPGLHISGYNLKEIPLLWGNGRDPKFISEVLKKSVTFTLLSALDFQLYALDSFIASIGKTYYGLHMEGEIEWVTPEIFLLASGIDLNKLENSDAVNDVRRFCGQLRQMKRSLSLSIHDYFELYKKMCLYATEIAHKVGDKVANDKKISGLTGGSSE
jgi:hypothetical protein